VLTRKHGEGSNGKETPEYRTWSAMLSRCRNPNHAGYANYGGRGITVCARWDDYATFLADMGRRPSPQHSLDRIDNEQGYAPENCRWATWVEQNNNQRTRSAPTDYGMLGTLAHGGREQTVFAWLVEVGLAQDTYRSRRRKGMTIEDAIFTPLMRPGRKPRSNL
jgi:hypothetical protein